MTLWHIPKGPGKTIEDIRKRSEHALTVAGPWRQKLARD